MSAILCIAVSFEHMRSFCKSICTILRWAVRKTVEIWYKYKNQKTLLNNFDNNFCLPPYFSAWLSGFTEAEGHFKLIKYSNNTIRSSQFTIGQTFEKHILKATQSNKLISSFN